MTIAFLSHPDCLGHEVDPQHPEHADRLHAIADELISSTMDLALRHYDAPRATREQLVRVHDADYVQRVLSHDLAQGPLHFDDDTTLGAGTLSAALRAAGAVVAAVDLVLGARAGAAFCGVRPPGHHAGRSGAMGFCIFNNVAVGAAHGLEHHGLQRIAIVDFDVHHGNGTEDIFRDDPRVLFCSTFQHPFYPWLGSECGGPRIVNVPLAAGSDGSVLREAVVERWLPALHAFRPDLVLISAGFDAHAQDPMGQLRWREDDYRWISRAVREVAERYAHGRIVSVLEGGYHLPALGRSVVAHLDGLLGQG